ncbi:lipopolysaccharide biosynthesis protein [Chrysiogenes arsenatis]|uniref:lipopolysaccharide biosynthesis protein n=1 Tax=Chrysiogenes arsenatis TaxID=309797 RepID=UPI000422CAF6|nr:oligosaccharide flippase family protein [Chrysiogenes arsenatis]
MALKRNLIANYLGQGWTALMSIAFVPLYINYLGIEAYGLIGFFAMIQAWLSLLDMGMTPTLNREMARFTGGNHSNESIRDLLRSIEIIAVGVAALITGGIALGAEWMANSWLRAETLPDEVVAQAFIIMGLVTALRFVEGVYRSTIIGLQRQVLFNVVISIMATLRGLGAVGILMWASPTIEAFFLWQGAVSIATLAVLGITTYRCMPMGVRGGRFSLDALRNVWRFAGGMMGITLLSLLLMQVDKLLLSKLLILSEFGYYTLATSVAAVLYMLINPITQAFFPKFCELHTLGNKEHLIDSYHKGAQLITVIAGSAALVIIFFSETLMQLWTQDYELATRTATLIRVLMLGNLLNGLMWIPYQTQLAHGWTSYAIWVNIVSVAIILPAILWVTPIYGALGAAWIWVGLNAGYILIGIHFMYRKILTTEKWRWYIEDLAIPLGAGLLTVSVLRYLLPDAKDNLMQLFELVIASVLTLAVMALASIEVRKIAINFWINLAPKK